MYYVIKRLPNTRPVEFIGFNVSKYLTNKSSDTVIFEFVLKGKITRKWVKKEEIILLTDDKEFYLQTLQGFKKTQEEQQNILNAAQEQLDLAFVTFADTMDSTVEEFEEIRNSSDVPDMLKNL